MKSKVLKSLIAFALIASMFGATLAVNPQEASACYPAYKCWSPTTEYKLFYMNPDRRLGVVTGSAVVGGLGFLGSTALSVATYAYSIAYGVREYYWGSLSYKVYIKKSDKAGYKYKTKTVYYSYTNYVGYYKTAYRYTN